MVRAQDRMRQTAGPDVDLPYLERFLGLERRLLTHVRAGDQQEALALARQLFALEAEHHRSDAIEILKSEILTMSGIMCREALLVHMDWRCCVALHLELNKAFGGARTPAEMEAHFLGYVSRLTSLINSGRDRLAQLLARSIEFVRVNYQRELTLEEVAAQAYLSPFHFSRTFKKMTGHNFKDYLTKLRLEEAKRLLADTPLTITQIASKVGYKSPGYFSTLFREREGCPPAQYRRVRGGNEQQRESIWQEPGKGGDNRGRTDLGKHAG